ncbi:MAG: glycosyltransferase family 2 protein [Thermoplasmataceae archaeon]
MIIIIFLGLILLILSLTILMLFRIILSLFWRKHFFNANDSLNYSPKVLVIVPCRGKDHDMERNFESLQNQDYKNFHIVAVVDSDKDEALGVINKMGIESLITDHYSTASSGKVRAITTAIRKKTGYEIIVFADSDTIVPEHWLKELIFPLHRKRIGAVSTYPRFVPMGGFWSKVKEIWGYMGINMMEFRPTRFVWGGSVAFRSELMDEESIKYFSTAVSDDAALSKICRYKGVQIAYAPAASPKIVVKDDKKSFLDWAERQMAVSIIFDKRALAGGVFIYIGVVVYMVMMVYLSAMVNPLFVLGFTPYILNLVNSGMRDPKNSLWLIPIGILLPFIYLYNIIEGAKASEINWRGTSYKIK